MKIDMRKLGKGLGTKSGDKMIGIRFPQNIDAILRDMPDKCEYIRELVRQDLIKREIISEFE